MINLEGLANDAGFYRSVVLVGEIDEYVERENIRWLVNCEMDEHPFAWRPNKPAYRLVGRFVREGAFPQPDPRICPTVVWRVLPTAPPG